MDEAMDMEAVVVSEAAVVVSEVEEAMVLAVADVVEEAMEAVASMDGEIIAMRGGDMMVGNIAESGVPLEQERPSELELDFFLEVGLVVFSLEVLQEG